MRAESSLLAEIQGVVKQGSHERRADMLKRITTLFIAGADRFTDDHVAFFDLILSGFINEIQSKARSELSIRLAQIGNAPRQVVRTLALDDHISVAGPLLQYSARLDELSLLDAAKSKSQHHLLAISYRRQITEPVTDVLLRRGDREVLRSVAGNFGADLSQFGFTSLVRKAESDGILAEKIGRRSDVPEPLLRDLFLQATRIVQKRILTTAAPDTKAKLERVLADISREFGFEASSGAAQANRATGVTVMREVDINEIMLAKLAAQGLYDETVAALAALCRIPLANMRRVMAGKRGEPAIVACKALGFAWPTTRAIILLQRKGLGVSAHSLEAKYRYFDKLSTAGAQDVMRLWQAVPDDQVIQTTTPQLPYI